MEAIIKNVQTGNLRDCCEIVLVFSNKQEAQGLETARQLGIKAAFIESKGKQRAEFDQEIVALLEPLQPDYLVLAGYMRLISPALIQRYRNRVINIHPADTALYQGAHAYQWAFDNKLETTKITVHFVDAGMDTGPVIAQREVDLRGAKNLAEVEQRGLRVEHVFYSEVLEKVLKSELK